MSTTRELTTSFVVQTCCHKNCHMVFGMPAEFDREKRRDHDWWYCPRGHKQYYSGTSDIEDVKRELAAEKERRGQIERQRDRAVERARREELSKRAHKGHLTRIKNRIANGVCPCCNRHFKNVHRHITSQHPEFKVPV